MYYEEKAHYYVLNLFLFPLKPPSCMPNKVFYDNEIILQNLLQYSCGSNKWASPHYISTMMAVLVHVCLVVS